MSPARTSIAVLNAFRSRRVLAVLGVIGAVLVGGIAFAAARQDDPDTSCDAPLPSLSAWSAGGDAQTDEGYRLAECDGLTGLTEADAERLLGPAMRDGGALVWQMGPDGIGIDFMFLGATLENGRITEADVYQG
jgi:hypothetical protein